jgi:hypothetical protein
MMDDPNRSPVGRVPRPTAGVVPLLARFQIHRCSGVQRLVAEANVIGSAMAGFMGFSVFAGNE